MKTRILLFCASLLLFAPLPTFAADDFVRLAIEGENVNLRPHAQAVGRAIAQANVGNVFIAEKQRVINEHDNSRWYEIVLALDAETNRIITLSEWNSRFKANSAFVHADFVTVSPLVRGDMDGITATLGAERSPEIYGKWIFMRSTSGPHEKPLYIGEFEYAPPSLEIRKDNTMVSLVYERASEGTLVRTDALSYTYTDVASTVEGEKIHEDIGGYITYVPKKRLLRYACGEVNHYYARDDR